MATKTYIDDNLVDNKEVPSCTATNLYDGTLYNFRVRRMCENPLLDPLEVDPADTTGSSELGWTSYTTPQVVVPEVAVSIPDRDIWTDPKTPTIVFNVLVTGHTSDYFDHMKYLVNSSSVFLHKTEKA